LPTPIFPDAAPGIVVDPVLLAAPPVSIDIPGVEEEVVVTADLYAEEF
jgi:hypothetical protein